MIKNLAAKLFMALLACSFFSTCKDAKEVYTGSSRGPKPLPYSPYNYELWAERGSDYSLTWYGPKKRGGAAFRAEWNNTQVFLGRIGYFWDEGKPYADYGNVFCDFAFTRSANGTVGGASYIGIYGWSKNPLIEWYIVEDWFADGVIGPSRIGGDAKKVGEFDVDGGTYFIYEATRVQKPSIDGIRTFKQFFSVRQTTRQKGQISITEHFKEWEKAGLILGSNMYEAKFLVEAGSGSGWLETQHLSFYKK
jgi:hypothetical protein